MCNLSPKKTTEHSISSIANLCDALDITPNDLDELSLLSDQDRYTRDTVEKSNGTLRTIYKPHFLLRKIQRRINRRIFTRIVEWPDYIFGSVPNTKGPDKKVIQRKDYVSCAAQHCESKSLLKIDIKDFFDNIHIYHVKKIFLDFFKYPEDVSELLADICCFEQRVVQGALTSSYIASLCLWDTEPQLVKRLQRNNLTYTRLVDDITVSSKVSNFQFEMAMSQITRILEDKDLPINYSKTKVSYVSISPLMVHGMRVNFSEPRYPSDELRKLRASVHNIEKLASQTGYRTTFAYRKDFNRCMGRVNKLKRVKHNKHAVLLKKLKKILPLPSKTDLKRISLSVKRLESDYLDKKETYWYRKRFYMAQDRLNILNRTFNQSAAQYRERLNRIKPLYDRVENG
ncbi:RNA-directed DNA polymerase [Vibrio splendidus]|nr:RNA-directed DNA polymerase [Vibrio splendidus]RLQ19427.1 RNA-directed DNA polymerase [Vibrio sp. SBT000027]